MKSDFQRLHVTVEINFLYARMCIIGAKPRPVETGEDCFLLITPLHMPQKKPMARLFADDTQKSTVQYSMLADTKTSKIVLLFHATLHLSCRHALLNSSH